MFTLHSNFGNHTHLIDLPLCTVLLEDRAHYPWILLIPRRCNSGKLMDLKVEDQLQLLKELDGAQKILWDLFQPTQLNVAAIGNKTPQLHVHVIARQENDPAWPHTVWDHPERSQYTPEEKQIIVKKLVEAFTNYKNHPLK